MHMPLRCTDTLAAQRSEQIASRDIYLTILSIGRASGLYSNTLLIAGVSLAKASNVKRCTGVRP